MSAAHAALGIAAANRALAEACNAADIIACCAFRLCVVFTTIYRTAFRIADHAADAVLLTCNLAVIDAVLQNHLHAIGKAQCFWMCNIILRVNRKVNRHRTRNTTCVAVALNLAVVMAARNLSLLRAVDFLIGNINKDIIQILIRAIPQIIYFVKQQIHNLLELIAYAADIRRQGLSAAFQRLTQPLQIIRDISHGIKQRIARFLKIIPQLHKGCRIFIRQIRNNITHITHGIRNVFRCISNIIQGILRVGNGSFQSSLHNIRRILHIIRQIRQKPCKLLLLLQKLLLQSHHLLQGCRNLLHDFPYLFLIACGNGIPERLLLLQKRLYRLRKLPLCPLHLLYLRFHILQTVNLRQILFQRRKSIA